MKRAPDPRRLFCYESRDRATERLRRERDRRQKWLTVILTVILIAGLILLADVIRDFHNLTNPR